MGIERTLAVLAACVAFLVAALAAGLVLFHTVQGPPASAWDDYKVTARGLAVGLSAKGCAQVTGATVAEHEDRVKVTLTVERELPWYGYCARRVADETVRVVLDNPLGDRRVYDGSCVLEGDRLRACLRKERAVGQPTGDAVSTANR